eukprot:COSAG02_NODE_281_length_25776_cov_37.797998_14_plen_116_part_00
MSRRVRAPRHERFATIVSRVQRNGLCYQAEARRLAAGVELRLATITAGGTDPWQGSPLSPPSGTSLGPHPRAQMHLKYIVQPAALTSKRRLPRLRPRFVLVRVLLFFLNLNKVLG